MHTHNLILQVFINDSMKNNVFKFRVQSLALGWCRVFMLINDKRIDYNASYLGPNPLASFIEACADLMEEHGKYYIQWQQEPGRLQIDLNLDVDKMLHVDIINHNEPEEEWHEVIHFDDFVSAIVSEGFRVLNAFGLYGYYRSWQDHSEFPLTNLLRITRECKEMWSNDTCSTDISKEIECLQNHIADLTITKETRMDECTIYYESWQIQCCGEPFSIGDNVGWTGCLASGTKNAHGVILDFEENHHGFPTHFIEGTVSKIIAERSEYPKGQKVVWYERTQTIQEEIDHADGWESEIESDETTDRTFWGYIVTLQNVFVKPLKK